MNGINKIIGGIIFLSCILLIGSGCLNFFIEFIDKSSYFGEILSGFVVGAVACCAFLFFLYLMYCFLYFIDCIIRRK